jgi:signal transduction histidine kinase/ligand-binding sensor domain-containing protein
LQTDRPCNRHKIKNLRPKYPWGRGGGPPSHPNPTLLTSGSPARQNPRAPPALAVAWPVLLARNPDCRRTQSAHSERSLLFTRLQILFALLVAVLSTSHAQDVRALHHQSWSTEEGLPQSSVHAILQSRDGYLWIATEGGVVRFDGVAFTTFRHESNPAFTSDDISSIAEDPEGALWFGTTDGLIRLSQGKWQRFGTAEGLPSASISALIATPDNSLLALTTNGLATFAHNRFQTLPNLPPDFSPISLAKAQSGGAWIVGQTDVLLLKDGALQPNRFGPQNQLSNLLGVAEGPNGERWTYSANRVTVTAGNTTREWKIGPQLPGARVETLSIDRHGTAWVGTNTSLVTLHANSDEAIPVPALDGNSILSTFEDGEGNEWIGTETSGLHVLRRLKFRTEPALANQALTAVVQTTAGAFWVGTREDGVRRLRAGIADEPVAADKLTSPVILSLAPGNNGSLWVGTPDGLNHLEANGSVQHITMTDGLPDDFIRSLLAEKDGSVWAGTRRGLAHIQGRRIDTLTRTEGLGGDLIGPLLQTGEGPAATLWIATSNGITALSADGKATTYTSANGLKGSIVSALATDRSGAVWVATSNGGLNRFANGNLHSIPFTSIKGLRPDAEITALAADDQGFLWLRSTRGIGRIPLADLTNCLQHDTTCSVSLQEYGAADGLPSEEAIAGRSPQIWPTPTGELWFPTRRGLAVVDADHLPFNPVPPPVVLQGFLVDDTPLDIHQQPLSIPFGHTRYTMEYAGLSYTAPPEVRYRFILEGFDQGWTDAGNRRSATYTNLPPRNYRFRVQAMNNDGVWNEAGAELQFRIIPPFYRRWWFALIVIACAIALFALLYQLRVQRLRTQFDAVLQERNRMAREIHDTLAQDFVGVTIQLDIVSQLLSASRMNDALQQVSRTRKFVTDGLAEARRSIWELRANTAADSLPTQLTKIVERYKNDGLTTRLRMGGAFRPLPARIESEVLRIAQEALSNAERHAQATEVHIELQYGSDMLVLAVEDNGRGFSVENASTAEGHYGLRGMRERASVLGGRLEVASEPGHGAKVTLFTPIEGKGHEEASR